MVVAKVTETNAGSFFAKATEDSVLNGKAPAAFLDQKQIELIVGHKVQIDSNGTLILSEADRKLLTVRLALDENLLNNPNLSLDQKRSILARLRQEYARSKSIDQIYDGVAAGEDLKEWLTKPMRLEKAEGSKLHKMLEACHSGKLIIAIDEDEPKTVLHALDECTSFVVQHDWASAFKGAQDFDEGEFHLPFPLTCFEFRVSGRRVMINCQEHETHNILCIPIVETVSGWMMPLPFEYLRGTFVEYKSRMQDGGVAEAMRPLMELVLSQIRAVAISLEAEVAETEIIRADYKLNRARAKRGKLPVADYHVISLARRTRAAPLPRAELDPDREITRKRLHFRRGHWRHYETRKVWIKWTLVGDPDLGWIDKHYKL